MVRVSWPGHPGLPKKKKKNQIENNKKNIVPVYIYIYIYIYFNSINCQDEVSSITIV